MPLQIEEADEEGVVYAILPPFEFRHEEPEEELPEPEPARILDFDIENRPLSYWYEDKATAEITAIAWCPYGQPKRIRSALLGRDSMRDILTQFVEAYNSADMVTGHFIRRHDLPIINGALLENGLPCLSPKLTSDTRLDLVRFKDLPASQEALGAMLGLKAPKYRMTQDAWRKANRLDSDAAVALTKKRVESDVIQHMQLRAELLRLGWLKGPRVWRA